MRHERIEPDPTREPRFWVQSEADAQAHRVLAHGELDLAAVPVLEQAITQAEQGSTTRIVLDLSGVTFVDSSGIHFLLRTCSRLKAEGDRLRIARLSAVVEDMVDMSGIRALLPLDAD